MLWHALSREQAKVRLTVTLPCFPDSLVFGLQMAVLLLALCDSFLQSTCGSLCTYSDLDALLCQPEPQAPYAFLSSMLQCKKPRPP